MHKKRHVPKNNPVNYYDWLGLKHVPLRSTIESLGGVIQWNSQFEIAGILLDDGYTFAYDGDPNGSYIDKSTNIMYCDDVWLFSALSVTFELGNGWKGRIERNTSGGRYDKHVHIYNGKNEYSQNEDGSPHDGSKGTPGKKQKEKLKKLKGWDWDQKEKDWLNKIKIENNYDGYSLKVSYPDMKTVYISLPHYYISSNYRPTDAMLKLWYISSNESSNYVNGSNVILPFPNVAPLPVPSPSLVPVFP